MFSSKDFEVDKESYEWKRLNPVERGVCTVLLRESIFIIIIVGSRIVL